MICASRTLTKILFIMKKIILVAAMVLGFAVAASAQPRALGIRGGWGAELSYQHSLGANFAEFDLGLYGTNSLNVAATYNFMLAQPSWTSRGEWGVYGGPGAVAGLGLGEGGYLSAGVVAQVGLEYSFWFPLQISLDIRPQIALTLADQMALGFGGFYPSLGLRYKF